MRIIRLIRGIRCFYNAIMCPRGLAEDDRLVLVGQNLSLDVF